MKHSECSNQGSYHRHSTTGKGPLESLSEKNGRKTLCLRQRLGGEVCRGSAPTPPRPVTEEQRDVAFKVPRSR